MKWFVPLMLIFSLSPGLVSAQGGYGDGMVERLIAELEITDQVLAKAQEVVRASDDQTAQTILRLAEERQSWARDQVPELQQQFRLRLHTAAMDATQKSREQARTAIAAVNRSDRHEGMVSRRLERTEELLDQVQQEIQDHPERAKLEELYDAARRNLDRAWEFQRSAEYRPALKLANQAASMADRILRAVRSGRPGVEEFERRQAALNRKIEEARERLDCELVTELINNAEQAYLDALEKAYQGEIEMAHQLLRKGNNMITQAIQNCLGLDDIGKGIERLQNQLQELTDRRGELDNSQLEGYDALLTQAREQIELAKRYADQKNYDAAKISVQAAINALNQARRILELY
jgi:hypothetical protein